MSDLQELKKEANDLGVSYNKNITPGRLQEKIEEFYASQETSGPPVLESAEQEENPVAEKEVTKTLSKEAIAAETRRKREAAARETKIVTIIDNDQRVNTHTTTCTVNCSNEFFDLGTRILPLNEKIEVPVGHIRTLERVRIPLHVRDPKNGLATVRLRPRYTISYSQ
jgi:hypothetical protein